MSDFTIVERTEPITLDEVLSFIDDTNISKMDAHELKSRIADVIQESRNKIVDEFAEKLCVACGEEAMTVIFENKIKADVLTLDGVMEIIMEIAEQLKAGEKNE